MINKFILASVSPRRKELLELVGLEFDVVPSDVDEAFRETETPRDHVMRLSREKALAVTAMHPDAWVLGADTIVLVNGEILGKPQTKDEAREMLRKLSGREHKVISGFTVLKKTGGAVFTDAVESTVVFKKLSADEIEWYVGTDEPYDKAGGYAAQGIGASLIREICGSYTNVVGLPLCEVVDALRQMGAARCC
jgi:septum formation protein